jgi:O-antigen/teichoic acid export membrane protein
MGYNVSFDNQIQVFVKSSLFKKGVPMLLWQALILILTLASSVWIARSLGPLELGRSGFIVATVSQILLVISVCPNTYAVRLTKNSNNVDDAISLVVTSRAFITVLYVSILTLAFVLGKIPSEWKTVVILGSLLPILMAFQPLWLFQALDKQVAQLKSSACIAAVVFTYTVCFIRRGGTANEELTARLIALTIGLILGWVLIGRPNPFKYVRFRILNRSLVEIWNSRTLFVTQIIVYLIVGLELPLMAYLLEIESLGKYRTATQLTLGLNAFIAILPMIYYPEFIELKKKSNKLLWDRQKVLSKYLAFFVIPTAVLVIWLGPAAFNWVFGESFYDAGIPFAILVCSKLVVLVSGVFAWGLWAGSKDLSILILFLAVSVVTLSSNILMIPRFGMIAAASINFFGQFCILTVTFFIAMREGQKA